MVFVEKVGFLLKMAENSSNNLAQEVFEEVDSFVKEINKIQVKRY